MVEGINPERYSYLVHRELKERRKKMANTILKIIVLIFVVLYFTACAQDSGGSGPGVDCVPGLARTLLVTSHTEFACVNRTDSEPSYDVIAIMGGDLSLSDSEYRTHLENLIAAAKLKSSHVIMFSEIYGATTSSKYSIAVEVATDKHIQMFDAYSVSFARVQSVQSYIIETLQSYQ